MSKTTFEAKTQILADVWRYYRWDANFASFVNYHDIALPLSFLILMKMVTKVQPEAVEAINETFNELLASFNLEDTGYMDLTEILPENY